MYGCPKWAPVNKEMDLLGSLKCLLKGGGRELFLGRGVDGPSLPMVRLLLAHFYVFAVWDLTATFPSSKVAYDLKLLEELLQIVYPSLQLKQQNAVLLS